MRILITGASGFIGQHLLNSCRDNGHAVTACAHNETALQRNYPDIKVIRCEYAKDHDVDTWLPRLNGIDVVVNAVGIFRPQGRNTYTALHVLAPRALFKACELSGVKKVIQISALGADDTAFSEYHLSKKAADDYLSRLELNWTIIMPSLVYGTGAKSWRWFTAMAALPITPFPDRGNQLLQPIHIDDLCRAVLVLLNSEVGNQKRIPAVGPQAVTLRQLYVVLKQRLGLNSQRFFGIPFWAALFSARLFQMLSNSPITGDALKMLRHGNTGNVRKFSRTLGFTPSELADVVLHQPHLTGERLDAKLYFLLPALRISLALLWIATGFVSAFAYPVDNSYAMLDQLGVPNALAPFALFSAAALDFVLGMALLFSFQVRKVIWLQVLLMLAYTGLISAGLPELWLHPFGPVTKNLPLIIATIMLLARDK